MAQLKNTPSDEALFEYHRTHSMRAFKLLFN